MEANAALLPESGARVSTQTYRWGEGAPPGRDWDVVLGSDTTYDSDNAPALTVTLHQLLQADSPPRVILAHDHRAREAGDIFSLLQELRLPLSRQDEGGTTIFNFTIASAMLTVTQSFTAMESTSSML